jgi:hypothetical protein
VQNETNRWFCYAEVLEDSQQFVFYSVCPIKIPHVKRLAVAEYIARANYGLVIGNFELDFDYGEVRCKTSAIMPQAVLEVASTRLLILTNLALMAKYQPGFLAVAYSEKSAMEAVTQVEIKIEI